MGLRGFYQNAGMQTQQGREELLRYWDAPDSDMFTVKCISLVLGIRLQKVREIPVRRIMIDKRGYYRKGDIQAWLEIEGGRPDSLLADLREEHAKTVERMSRQPSRRYRNQSLSAGESKAAREKTKTNRLKEPDEYEALLVPASVELVWSLQDKNKF